VACLRINADALHILQSDPDGPEHIFVGLLEQLPDLERQKLLDFRPRPDDSKEIKRDAYHEQLKYMEKHADRLFCNNFTATNCCKHPNAACQIWWSDAGQTPQKARPLKENFSGPMCTPWSSHGQMLGESDASMESFNFWTCQMEASNLDLVFVENSDKFDWSLFKNKMERNNRWETHRIVFGAQDIRLSCRVQQQKFCYTPRLPVGY
jgi:hypothetical protein